MVAARAMLNNPVFLDMINKRVQSSVPDSIPLASVAKASASAGRECQARAPDFLGGGCLCYTDYDVSAQLSQCSGLKSVRIKKWVLEGSGWLQGDGFDDLTAKVGAELAVDTITCTGVANTKGTPCVDALAINVPGSVSATVGVNRISAQVSAKVVPGTGADEGKLCLKVENVSGELGQDNIQIEGFDAQLGELPIDIPKEMLDSVWKKLPLDSVFNDLKNTALGKLESELKDVAPCFELPF
jgi:hypothetical protein